MAYNSTVLGIGLTLDTQGYSRELKATGKETGKVLNSLEAQAQNFSDRWSDITRNLRSVKSVASSMALYSTFQGIANVVSTASAELMSFSMHMENATVSMQYFVEGSDKAAKSLAYLREMQALAAETSFTTESAINLSQFMSAMGINLKATKSVMKVINDAAAATGASEANMSRIVTALGQILTKGRLAAEEIRQLANANIPIYEILQEQMGLTGDQIKNIGKYWIDANESVVAILTGLQTRYEGAADKIADTMSGMANSIYDNSLMIGKVASSDIYEKFEEKVKVARDALSKYRDVAVNEGSTALFRTMLLDADASGKVGTQLLTLVGNARNLISTYGSLYNTIKPLIGMFGQGLYYSVNTLITGFTALGNVVETTDEILSHFGVSLEDVFTVAAQVYITYKVAKTFGYVGQAAASAAIHIYHLATGFKTLLPAALTANTSIGLATVSILGLGAIALYASGALDGLFNSFAKLDASDNGLPSDFERQFEEYRKSMETYNNSIKQYEGTFDESFESIAAAGTNTFAVLTKKSTKAAKQSADRWLASFDEVYKVPDITEDITDEDLNFADLASLVKDLQYIFPAKVTAELLEPDFDWSSVFTDDVADGVGAAFEKFLPIGVAAMSLGLAQAFKKRFQEEQAKAKQVTGKAAVETPEQKIKAQKVKLEDDISNALKAVEPAITNSNTATLQSLKDLNKTLTNLNDKSIKLTGTTNQRLLAAIDDISLRITDVSFETALTTKFNRIADIFTSAILSPIEQKRLLNETATGIRKLLLPLSTDEVTRIMSRPITDSITVYVGNTPIEPTTYGELYSAAQTASGKNLTYEVERFTTDLDNFITEFRYDSIVDSARNRLTLEEISTLKKRYNALVKITEGTTDALYDVAHVQMAYISDIESYMLKAVGMSDFDARLSSTTMALKNTLGDATLQQLKASYSMSITDFNRLLSNALTTSTSKGSYISQITTIFDILNNATDNAEINRIDRSIAVATKDLLDTYQKNFTRTLTDVLSNSVREVSNLAPSKQANVLEEALQYALSGFGIDDTIISQYLSSIITSSLSDLSHGATARIDKDILNILVQNSKYLSEFEGRIEQILDIFAHLSSVENRTKLTAADILSYFEEAYLPSSSTADFITKLNLARTNPLLNQDTFNLSINTLLKSTLQASQQEVVNTFKQILTNISETGPWTKYINTLGEASNDLLIATQETISTYLANAIGNQLPLTDTTLFVKRMEDTLDVYSDVIQQLPDSMRLYLKDALLNITNATIGAIDTDAVNRILTVLNERLSVESTPVQEAIIENVTTDTIKASYKNLDEFIQAQNAAFKTGLTTDADLLEFRKASLRIDELFQYRKQIASVFNTDQLTPFKELATQIISDYKDNEAVTDALMRYLKQEVIPTRFTNTGQFISTNAISFKTGKTAYYDQYINDEIAKYIAANTSISDTSAERLIIQFNEIAKKINNPYDVLDIMQRVVSSGGIGNIDEALLNMQYMRISDDLAMDLAYAFDNIRIDIKPTTLDKLDNAFTRRTNHLYDIMISNLAKPSNANLAYDVILNTNAFSKQAALTQLKAANPDFFNNYRELFKDTKIFAAGGTLGAFASPTGVDRFGKSVMEYIYTSLNDSIAYELGLTTKNVSSLKQVFGYQRGNYLEKWVGNFLLPGHFNNNVRAGLTWYDPVLKAVSQMDLVGQLNDIIVPIEVKTTSLGAKIDKLDEALQRLTDTVDFQRNITVNGNKLNTALFNIPDINSVDFYNALKAYDSSAALQIAHLANVSGRDKVSLAIIDANNEALQNQLAKIYAKVEASNEIQNEILRNGLDTPVVREKIMQLLNAGFENLDDVIAKATRTIIFTVPEAAKREANVARVYHNELLQAIVEQNKAGIPLQSILQQVSATGMPLGVGFHANRLQDLAKNMPILPDRYNSISTALIDILDNLRKQSYISVQAAEKDLVKLRSILSDDAMLLRMLSNAEDINGLRTIPIIAGKGITVASENNFAEFIGKGGIRDTVLSFISALDAHNATNLHMLEQTLSKLPDELFDYIAADNVISFDEMKRVLTMTQRLLGNAAISRDNQTVIEILNLLDALKEPSALSFEKVTRLETLLNDFIPTLQYATPETLIQRIRSLEPGEINTAVVDTLVSETFDTDNITQATQRISDAIDDITDNLNDVVRTTETANTTSQAFADTANNVSEAATRVSNKAAATTDDIARSLEDITSDALHAFQKLGINIIEKDAVTLGSRFSAIGDTFHNAFKGISYSEFYKANSFMRLWQPDKILTNTFSSIIAELYGGANTALPRGTAAADTLITYITRANAGDFGKSHATIATAQASLREALQQTLGDDAAIAAKNLDSLFEALTQNSKTLNKFNFDSIVKSFGSLKDIDISKIKDLDKFIENFQQLPDAYKAISKFIDEAISRGYAKNADEALKVIGKTADINLDVLRNFNDVSIRHIIETLSKNLGGDDQKLLVGLVEQLTEALNNKNLIKGITSKALKNISAVGKTLLEEVIPGTGLGYLDFIGYAVDFIFAAQRQGQYKEQYNKAIDSFLASTLDLKGLDIDKIKADANVNEALDNFWNSYGTTVVTTGIDALLQVAGRMLGTAIQAFVTGTASTSIAGPGAIIGGLVAAGISVAGNLLGQDAGMNSFYNQYSDDIKKQIYNDEYYTNLRDKGYTDKDARKIADALNRFSAFNIAESVYESKSGRGEAGILQFLKTSEYEDFKNTIAELMPEMAKFSQDIKDTFDIDPYLTRMSTIQNFFSTLVTEVEKYRADETGYFSTQGYGISKPRFQLNEAQRLYDEMEVFLIRNATGVQDEGFTEDIIKFADNIPLGSDMDAIRRALEGLSNGINLLSVATGKPINFYSADIGTQAAYTEQLADIYMALTKQATAEAVAEQVQGILSGNAFTLNGETATIFATLSTESFIVADGLSRLYESLGLTTLSADALESSLSDLGYTVTDNVDLSKMVAFGTATQDALDAFRSNLAGWSVELPDTIDIGTLSAEDVSILASAGVQITDTGAIFAQAQEAGEAGAERDFAYDLVNVTAAEAERLAKDFKVTFDEAGNLLLDRAAILQEASQMSFMFDADVANLSTAANTLLAGYYEEVDTQGNVIGRVNTGFEGLGEYNTETGTFTITNADILAGNMTIEDWINNLQGTNYYKELFENAQGGSTGLYNYLTGLSKDATSLSERLGISYQEALSELAQSIITIVDTNISEQYGPRTRQALAAAGINVGEYGNQYGITYGYLGEGWESGQNKILTSEYEKLSDAAKNALNVLADMYNLGIDIGNVYTTLDVAKTFNPEKMQYFYSVLDDASLKALPSYTLEWLKHIDAIQQAEDGTYIWVQGMETASTGLIDMTGNLVGNYALLSDELQNTLTEAANFALGYTEDTLNQYMQNLENGYATIKFVSDEAELNMADTNQRISFTWEELANSENTAIQSFEEDMLRAAASQLGFTDTSEMDLDELRTKVGQTFKGLSISADLETAFGDSAQLFDKLTTDMTNSATTMADTIEASIQRVVDSIDRLANIQLANDVSTLEDKRFQDYSNFEKLSSDVWLENKGNGSYRFFFGKDAGGSAIAYEISNAASLDAVAQKLIAALKLEGKSETDISNEIVQSIAKYGIANNDKDTTKHFIELLYQSLGMQIPSTLKQGYGFANGGIVANDGLYRIAEQNRKEAIIPLENPVVSSHIGAAIASMILASEEFRVLAPLQGIRDGGISTRIVDARSAAATQQSNPEEVAAVMADAVLQRILPTIISSNSTSADVVDARTPVYVGTLIADDTGLRELNKKMKVIEAKESRRV